MNQQQTKENVPAKQANISGRHQKNGLFLDRLYYVNAVYYKHILYFVYIFKKYMLLNLIITINSVS